MSRRSQNRNQYESTTTGELAAGAFTVTVVSTAGLITNQDMYLVIEPDIPGQREWIKIESITGNQLNIANPNGRNLEGSDGDLTHPAGSKVRSVPTQQIFEDIFSDAEDDELALTQHETDGGDPHSQAGYLTVSETDPLYVNITGDTMASLAQIKVDTNPVVLDDLSRKGYVDDQDASTLSTANDFSTALDHDHATPIAAHDAIANAHHVKTPDQTFLHADLSDVSTSQHHVKYTDAEAISAARGDFGARPQIDYLGAGTDQTLPTGVTTILTIWSNAIVDPDNLLSGNTTFTAPETGFYILSADVEFQSNVDGQRVIQFQIDGTRTVGISDKDASVGQDFSTISFGLFLSTGQTVVVRAFQSSGFNLDIDNSGCEFSVVKVSD